MEETKCIIPYCRKKKPKNRRICHRHREHRYKAKHLDTYTLNKLRQSARRRGIDFTLTLDEFRGFCARTNYLLLKGRSKEKATIGRINHDEGYHWWNIQLETNSLNSSRKHDNQPF